MQAASALLANAISAPGGESGAASDASGGGDAFTSALAALMSVLGQAQPTQQTSAATGDGGAGGSGAAGSATTTFFQPTTGATAAATASAAAGPLAGGETGPMADALQALASVVSELEAATRAAQAAGDTTPVIVQAPGGDASAAGASGSASGGAAAADASDGPLAALLSQLQAASGSANPASEPATSAPANPAPSSGPALDPQLIRFVARGTASATDASAASDATSAGADAAATAAQVDAQTSQQASSATDAPSSADGAPAQAPANPAASGLIVFNPTGQLTQIATSAQPGGRSAATRLSASMSATSTADAAAKPAGPAIDLRAGGIALFDDRAGADDIAPAGGASSGQPGDDSDPGSGDASAGAGTAAFQLATGAAAAPALLPPAAAALAQAHGAEVTAQLAAQIANRAGAVRSSFDFSLDPQGLGRVDVSLKIDQQGQLSAVLSFDNPAVAAEARARAGDLQQALQQAGFDVSQSGLSFTGGQGHGAAFQNAGQPSYAVSAPGFADSATPDLPTISATLAAASSAGGLDITI